MKRIDKTQQVYEYINRFISDNGYSPTVREICHACDIKSTATAFGIMNRPLYYVGFPVIMRHKGDCKSFLHVRLFFCFSDNS